MPTPARMSEKSGAISADNRPDIDERHDADRIGDLYAGLERGRDVGRAAGLFVVRVARRDLLDSRSREPSRHRRQRTGVWPECSGDRLLQGETCGKLAGKNDAVLRSQALISGD